MVRAGALLLVTVVACGAPDGPATGAPPDEEPFIEGTVTNMSPFEAVTEDCIPPDELHPDGTVTSDDPPVCTGDSDVLGTILVETTDGGAQASLTVTEQTQVLRETGGGHEPAGFSDLTQGRIVAAWVSGPVAESFPVQANAAAVVLRDG